MKLVKMTETLAAYTEYYNVTIDYIHIPKDSDGACRYCIAQFCPFDREARQEPCFFYKGDYV